ncbi:hypothetical protein EYF80_067181 [Liparis tanakae]|uniref:Uncharacterized protein n=1 Tax=Liparis tanakae TaxID=230148 RepID=A0A4Z2E1Z7_9TELE|nr:hypothetical protein EYF80_067181 [Liparis tanakae]
MDLSDNVVCSALDSPPSPSSPPTAVVSAHVHPAPPACPLPVPESGASCQAAVAPPAAAAAPPEPDARASPPLEPLEPPMQPQVPEAASPPEPVPESAPVEVAARPSTPPERAHTPATTSPAPQREVSSQQEPEENSESDIQDISGGDLPDPESAENGEVSFDPVSEPQPTPSETDTPPRPDLLQTTVTSTEVRPPQSPSPTQMNSDVTDGSSFLPVTPERPPVQDTTPPAVVLKPEETPEHPSTQVNTKTCSFYDFIEHELMNLTW